ncbi:MAG: hypothetical protein HRU25_16590 [Psychrobium sp.]|nr:hypothetical protein [Psychrobium sp.]
MEYIGKFGEHLVMLNLLQRNIESYMAIKSNQEDYDITVVLNNKCVKRLQVKATELQNKNTNNSISGTEKNYDYLVLVIIDDDGERVFILTKAEADKERSKDVKFSCSRKEDGIFKIKDNIIKYENCWDKISSV